MSDNRKYYYLKLKENFYNSETMVILESMQDGLLYRRTKKSMRSSMKTSVWKAGIRQRNLPSMAQAVQFAGSAVTAS